MTNKNASYFMLLYVNMVLPLINKTGKQTIYICTYTYTYI